MFDEQGQRIVKFVIVFTQLMSYTHFTWFGSGPTPFYSPSRVYSVTRMSSGAPDLAKVIAARAHTDKTSQQHAPVKYERCEGVKVVKFTSPDDVLVKVVRHTDLLRERFRNRAT